MESDGGAAIAMESNVVVAAAMESEVGAAASMESETGAAASMESEIGVAAPMEFGTDDVGAEKPEATTGRSETATAAAGICSPLAGATGDGRSLQGWEFVGVVFAGQNSIGSRDEPKLEYTLGAYDCRRAMASSTTFFTLLLYTITVFLLDQGAGKNRSACPIEFSCGSLGTMKYPFSSNISGDECGLLKLECDAVPLPRIRVGRKYYYVYGKLGDYIRLYDPELEQLVLNRPRCNSFDMNVSFPNSPWVSFVIPHNFTVFKCSNTPNLAQQMNIFGYSNHTKCRDFSLFYRPPGEGDPLPNLPNHHGFPPMCSPILLPFEKEYSTMDLFNIISVTFVLEWLLKKYHVKGHSGNR
nr:LEAF RUST 10 DISEASE-RESISTANCE LOCUS RECEPTOR-LIKE PROTEIN KINASE-like 1.1 [Ipomoea trifida]